MKRIIHKVLLIGIFLTLLLLFNSSSKITKANDEEISNFPIITGILRNESGITVKNKEIEFINLDDGNIEKVTTNSNGEYYINLKKGRYTIKCDEILSVQGGQYNNVDGINVEIAFIYSQAFKDKVNVFKYNLLGENGKFRFIDKTPVNSLQELKTQLLRLMLNHQSEEAFHIKPNYSDSLGNQNKCMIVFALPYKENIKKDDVNNLLKNVYMFNGDIITLQFNYDEYIQTIIKSIYNSIEENNQYSDFSNSVLTIENSEVKNLQINNTTILNMKVKENSKVSSSETQAIQLPGNFIHGKIEMTGSNRNIENNCKVILKNTKYPSIMYETTTINGEYSFGDPGDGKYILQFEFNPTALDGTLNGQYYEFDKYEKILDLIIGNDKKEVKTNNCILKSNSDKIKQEFNNSFTYLGYENDLEELKHNSADLNIKNKVKLIASTNEFLIKEDHPDDEHVNRSDYGIEANIKLRERPKFSLTLKQKIKQFKIVLTNGQVFKQFNAENNEDRDKFFGSLNSGLFNITFDDSSRYGAKLYVEYEVEITNNGDIDCKDYDVLLGFNNLEYNKDQYLLSNISKKNSTYNISQVSKIDDYLKDKGMFQTIDNLDYSVFFSYKGYELARRWQRDNKYHFNKSFRCKR